MKKLIFAMIAIFVMATAFAPVSSQAQSKKAQIQTAKADAVKAKKALEKSKVENAKTIADLKKANADLEAQLAAQPGPAQPTPGQEVPGDLNTPSPTVTVPGVNIFSNVPDSLIEGYYKQIKREKLAQAEYDRIMSGKPAKKARIVTYDRVLVDTKSNKIFCTKKRWAEDSTRIIGMAIDRDTEFDHDGSR